MEISRHWRLQAQRYGLIGEVCPHCKVKIIPARDICPNCAGESKTEYAFSGKGEVYSYTTVYDPPEEYKDMAPYTVVIVKLDEGPFITAQITDVDNDQVEIGMPVEMTFRWWFDEPAPDGSRDKGYRVYGFKFRPQLTVSSSK